jgi:hypothetical protein
MKRVLLAACVLSGCASGRAVDGDLDAAIGGPEDANKIWLDGQLEGTPDAPADAQMVVPVDAAPDAYQCQVQTVQLLQNPVFDLTPMGVHWVQQTIDSAYPLVTGDDGVPEHTAPFKVWLGGLEGVNYNSSSVTDVLYQDVSVPAGTTALRLTGYYEVRTAETTTTMAYDSAVVALVQTNGTPIATVRSLSNLTPTTAWTAFDHTFANASALAGQTVQLRLTSTNDVVEPTSFFFDTLALTATFCQ